jgi:hypothetical protein
VGFVGAADLLGGGLLGTVINFDEGVGVGAALGVEDGGTGEPQSETRTTSRAGMTAKNFTRISGQRVW